MKRLSFDKDLPNAWPFPSEEAIAAARAYVPKRAQPKPKKKRGGFDPTYNDARAKPVTVDGIRFPSLASAAQHFGVPRPTAQARIHRGWQPELAVSTPTRRTLH